MINIQTYISPFLWKNHLVLRLQVNLKATSPQGLEAPVSFCFGWKKQISFLVLEIVEVFFWKMFGETKNCLWSFDFLNGWTLLSLLSFSLTRFLGGRNLGGDSCSNNRWMSSCSPPRWWIVVYWCGFLPRSLKWWKNGHRTMGMSFWSRIWRGHVGFPWGFAKRRCFWKHWNQGFSVVYQPDWLFCLMNVKNILHEKANIWIESRRFPWITFLKYFDSNVFYLVKNHAILIFR